MSTTALSNADLSTAAHEVTALESQVAAYQLAVLAEAKDRGQQGPVGEEGDPDPAAWLAKLTGDPCEVLRGGTFIAGLLQTKYHHTRRALETAPSGPGRCACPGPRSSSAPPNAPRRR